MYKVFSMDILGTGAGSIKNILGTSGGGGAGGGPIIKGIRTVFTFKANDTELKKDLNLIDGELLLRDPEKGEIRFSNGNDTITRGLISFNDTVGEISYNTDQFRLVSSDNPNVIVTDRDGFVGINKQPDPSYNVDLSGSINLTGTLYRDGYDILFNLGKLFDYLTKPAPAFEKNQDISDNFGGTLSIQRTSFNITLFWKKGIEYDTSYNFALDPKELPYINRIGIDIIDTSGILNDWVNVTSSIDNYDLSYIFAIDSQYTDNSGNIFTSNKDSIFHLRVYPINSTNDLGDPFNYLVFQDLSFVAPSPPTAPRNLSVQLVGDTQRTYKIDFIKPQFNDSGVIGIDDSITDEPPIIAYRIQYQPSTRDCLRFPNVLDTSAIILERDASNQTTTYTITDDGTTDIQRVYPGTTYDISLSAKNEQDDSFGDVSSVSIRTDLPEANDFLDVDLSNINYSGHENINVFFPTIGNSNIQYFNLYESYNQISTTDVCNTLFINFHKLGSQSDNRQEDASNLAHVIAYHKVAGTEIEDGRVVFDGYNNDTFIEGEGYHGGFRVIYPMMSNDGVQFVDISNIDANLYKDDRPEYYGFGLRAQYKLDLSGLIGNAIGSGNTRFEPSMNEYEIGYKVQGTQIDKANLDDISKSYIFYVDDLSGNPTVNLTENSINTVNYLYAYGIPSIETFNFVAKWQTSNNGRYFLPVDGIISRIENTEQNTTIASANPSQNYNTTQLPKDITFDLSYTTNLFFKTQYLDNKLLDVFRIYSYHNLRTDSSLIDVLPPNPNIFAPPNGLLLCDYNSYTSLGNGKIIEIKPFGKENIYQYDKDNSYNPIPYDPSSNTPILRDNQLLYYDGHFVNPQYQTLIVLTPYRDFVVYHDNTPIEISYNDISNTGDLGVKWLVKRFTGITSDANTQKKRLLIEDNSGNHSDYSLYTDRLFFLQFYSEGIGTRVSGWLNPNVQFDDQEPDFLLDRGVQNISSPDEFYLYAESGKTFDVYVRIGLQNNNQSQTYIDNLTLQDA